MSQTIKRLGAVRFSQPTTLAARRSETPVFAKQEVDFVDPEWGDIIETVKSFASLDDDWDAGGSVAPEPSLVYMSIELARQLEAAAYPAPSRVIAGVNGTVSFEFAGEPFTEIEVVSPYAAEIFENGKLVNTLHADVDS